MITIWVEWSLWRALVGYLGYDLLVKPDIKNRLKSLRNRESKDDISVVEGCLNQVAKSAALPRLWFSQLWGRNHRLGLLSPRHHHHLHHYHWCWFYKPVPKNENFWFGSSRSEGSFREVRRAQKTSFKFINPFGPFKFTKRVYKAEFPKIDFRP